MRLLYVTGRQAAGVVRELAGGGDVEVMPIEVAGLLSQTIIERELSRKDLSGFDLIVVPGGVSGDCSGLGKRLGVPIVKGPKHAADIPVFLEHLGDVEYSANCAADEILSNEIKARILQELSQAKKVKTKFSVGKTNPVYLGEVMHVVAEIPDAPKLSDEKIKKTAKYFVESGASIIDLGFVSGEDNSEEAERLVSAVRDAVGAPVSVDSLNEKEILAGVDAGADLILSLCVDNIGLASSIDVPFVVVPTKDGRLKLRAEKRVDALVGLIDSVGDSARVIADPVASPLNLGLAESIKACMLFKERLPNVPLFFGAGNVTELLDADSAGANAVLAGIAKELGVNLLFTTEASNKTQGSVGELSTAAAMMYLAKKRGQPPKDLGLDLLFLKDKRKIEAIEEEDGVSFKHPSKSKTKLDDSSFRIYIKDDLIKVVYRDASESKRGWRGGGAHDLAKTILNDVSISHPHTAYLGRELAKAEIALRLGKNYVQDECLF